MTGATQHALPAADPLPDGLPVPADDGAARHLPGLVLPPVALVSTDGTLVRLDRVSLRRWVLFLYPRTGATNAADPEDWDAIPGARGCTQEVCSFRDSLAVLAEHGASRVVALSSDDSAHQASLVERFHLPYPMLSDPGLSVARTLGLPTFVAAGRAYYRRLTLVVDGDGIRHAFYPVFPPQEHAAAVGAWLAENPA